MTLIKTVQENEEGYSKRQIKDDDTNDKDNKIVENKSGKKKTLSKKKSVQFANINKSTEEECGNGSVFAG